MLGEVKGNDVFYLEYLIKESIIFLCDQIFKPKHMI